MITINAKKNEINQPRKDQPVLAAILFALATLGFESSPIGVQGLLNDVPMLTTVKLLHFIPSNTTHSPVRARRSVAMHNLVQVRKQEEMCWLVKLAITTPKEEICWSEQPKQEKC